MQTKAAKILIVDDQEANREMLADQVTLLGHDHLLAENGLVALAQIEKNAPDLVLLDIMMPEMDGYQVLERLKADGILRHIPVIVISALDEMDSVVRCIANGAEDYLVKPCKGEILKARIGNCLEKKYLRDQEQAYLARIEEEKRRADALLRVILPDSIAEELKTTNKVEPRRCENVAVLFADVVGFTSYCDRCEPPEVLRNLQDMVLAFERLATRYQLQKIKTIGDCFMATGGLLSPSENPVKDC